MNRINIAIRDLPSECFVNEQARAIRGLVRVAEHLKPSLGNLRLMFHGGNDPSTLGGVELVLDSIPSTYLALSASGQTVEFGPHCSGSWVVHFFGPNASCKLGAGTTSNGAEILLNDNARFEVGQDCMFAGGITVHVGDNHAIFDLESCNVLNYRQHPYVKLEEHVWVGQRAALIGDCTIGRGAVVASYSVIHTDVPAYCLVAGVPGEVKKQGVSWTRSYRGVEAVEVRNWLTSVSR